MDRYPVKQNIIRMGLFASAIGVLAAGCAEGEPNIKDGKPATVIEHEYDDRDVWLMYNGKTHVPVVDPEHFYLRVEQCDRKDDEDADERGCVVDSVEVSEETYNSYPDGSQIIFE